MAAETFAVLTGQLLFGFGEGPGNVKNQIIKNFIARTIKAVRGVMVLWELDDIQDCWIIHRCLVDRFFHLVELGKSKSYEVFDDWSFVRQFEAQNHVRSDPNCKDLLDSPLFKPTSEQRARYASLAKSRPQWHRPKAEDVAKGLRLSFLYTYSYDYASSHIHPMANDGCEDFYDITKLEPRPDFPSQISVVHNSLLIGCLLVQEGLNQSDFRWRAIVFNFYEQLANHLADGSADYKLTFMKIAKMGPETKLSEPIAEVSQATSPTPLS
jgi:hypothetical protein